MVGIVIPAFNEASKIRQVVQSLLDLNYYIIVVDDGSIDNTNEQLNNLPIFYLKHDINLGQGAALKTGTDFAKSIGCKYVIHYDADGQHRVEDLKNILSELIENNHDVVLGSRFLEIKSDIPKKKQLVLNLASLFTQKILNLKFSDPQNGLRAFNLNVYHHLDWQKNDFQHCSEILNLIMKNNLKFKELPIKINYDNYSQTKANRPKISMGLKLFFYKLFN